MGQDVCIQCKASLSNTDIWIKSGEISHGRSHYSNLRWIPVECHNLDSTGMKTWIHKYCTLSNLQRFCCAEICPVCIHGQFTTNTSLAYICKHAWIYVTIPYPDPTIFPLHYIYGSCIRLIFYRMHDWSSSTYFNKLVENAKVIPCANLFPETKNE